MTENTPICITTNELHLSTEMGDINNFSDLPSENIEKTLAEIVGNNLNTKNYKLHCEKGSSKGDNYIGILYRVRATKENKINKNSNEPNRPENKELNLIIKLPPQNAIRRKQFFARPCFLREALAYDEVIPLFMEFQRSKGITPEINGFHEVPFCFKTSTEDNNESVILEDLKTKGFEMYNRMNDISLDCAIIVMKTLAKFHAISLAIKDQEPELLSDYKTIEDIFEQRKDDNNLKKYFSELKKRALNTLCRGKDKKLIQKIENFFNGEDYLKTLLKLIDGRKAEPYSVLCHGDCWNNNILYRFEKNQAVDIRLIDWQIMKYASPICDIMYFLFSCTSKKFRDEHYSNLINIYYEQFASSLRSLGSNPENVFPREALDDQLKMFGAYGFMMALLLLPVFTAHAEDVPDLDELSEQLNNGNLVVDETFNSARSMDTYSRKMREVFQDMDELGYI